MPAALDAQSVGPVDVAVILFEGNKFSGDVAPALAELNDSGTVRIIDFAFVRKETDGSASVVEAGDAEVAEKAAQQQQAAAYQQQQEAAQQQAMVDQAASQAAAQTAAQMQAQQAAAAPPPPAAPPAAAPDDRMAKIKELGEMKIQGLLTDEEFAAEKARILGT